MSSVKDTLQQTMPPPAPVSPHRMQGPPVIPSNTNPTRPFPHLPPSSPNPLRTRSVDHDMEGTSPPLIGHYPRSLPVSPMSKTAGDHRPRSLPDSPMGKTAGDQQHMIHFTAPMPIPPEPSEKQKAMEAAVAAERMRARELEKEEESMSADELRSVLKKERRRTSKMAADLASFKMAAVELQSEAEVIEEGRINGLMRRLDNMQQEKGRIILDLEREEEMLTNTLQKQLNEVRREKLALRQQIEREKKSNSTLESHLTSLKESSTVNAGSMEGVLEEDEEDE